MSTFNSTTRAAWADQELSCHRFETWWRCHECDSDETSPQDLDRRFQGHHLALTRPELRVAKNAQSSNARPIETEEYLLCRDTPAQSCRTFIKHVGHHMEEMALFALPRDSEDDSEGLSDVSSQNSNAVGEVEIIQLNPDVKQMKTPVSACLALIVQHISHPKICSKSTAYLRIRAHSSVSLNVSAATVPWVVDTSGSVISTWRCDLVLCAYPFTSGHKKHILHTESSEFLPSKGKRKKINLSEMRYHDFDRKDLFTQHITRMHVPCGLPSNADKAAFEARIPISRDRCHLQLRNLPMRCRCLYCPYKTLEGGSSWTDRLEHVDKHLEKNDVEMENEIKDEDQITWMMQHR